jgi:uncharacterized protein
MSVAHRKRVLAFTAEYGGDWAVQHAQRLIRLVEIVGEGLDYNHEAIWLAAHMHDWGTLPGLAREQISHSKRSTELASEFLERNRYPKALRDTVVEAIAYHHGGADERCIEAILLRDADALDGVGALGVLREFASIPTEDTGCYSIPVGYGLKGAWELARMRFENNPGMLRLPKSRALARRRLRTMRALFEAVEKESFGYL